MRIKCDKNKTVNKYKNGLYGSTGPSGVLRNVYCWGDVEIVFCRNLTGRIFQNFTQK